MLATKLKQKCAAGAADFDWKLRRGLRFIACAGKPRTDTSISLFMLIKKIKYFL